MGKDIALSVRQPWAWLLVNGHKDVENRNWSTKYRGKCLIHASKTFDHDGYEWVRKEFGSQIDDLPAPEEYELGGIIGEVEICDCVTEYESPWFFGKYGFVVKNAAKHPFKPLRGLPGFFKVTRPDEEVLPEDKTKVLLDKIKVRLIVKPSSLAKAEQIARVTISVENLDGDPIEGVALTSEIVPDTMGSVSKLPPTDTDGHSYGEWIAGNVIGVGSLKIKVDGTEEKAEVEIRLKPDISVVVDYPVLVACSGASANIVVTVEDQHGKPVQGIKLSGWTLPSTLGSVTELPDSDADGFSKGTWTAGKKPGKGYLIVRGGGAQGQAAIELIRPDNGCDDGDNGDDNDDNGDNGKGEKGNDNGDGDDNGGEKVIGNGDNDDNEDNGKGEKGNDNGDGGDNGGDGSSDGGNGNGDNDDNRDNGNDNGGTGEGGVGGPSSKHKSSRFEQLKSKYDTIKKNKKTGGKSLGSGG